VDEGAPPEAGIREGAGEGEEGEEGGGNGRVECQRGRHPEEDGREGHEEIAVPDQGLLDPLRGEEEEAGQVPEDKGEGVERERPVGAEEEGEAGERGPPEEEGEGEMGVARLELQDPLEVRDRNGDRLVLVANQVQEGGPGREEEGEESESEAQGEEG